MLEWIHELGHWVAHWANTPYTLWAIFCIAFAESSFFPIPPDVLLIASAVLRPEKAFVFALLCSAGSVSGAVFGYFLGLKGGRPLLKRVFPEDRIQLVERYYGKWDVWAIGIAGFTPIPYKIFTLSAGVFRLDLRRFILVSILSRSARFFLVAGAIYFFGPTIRKYLTDYLNLFTVLFVVLLVGGFLAVRHVSHKSMRSSTTDITSPDTGADAHAARKERT